jgi:hypothetical protein
MFASMILDELTPEQKKNLDEWIKMRREFMKNGGCIPNGQKHESVVVTTSRTLVNQHLVTEALVRALQPRTGTNDGQEVTP